MCLLSTDDDLLPESFADLHWYIWKFACHLIDLSCLSIHYAHPQPEADVEHSPLNPTMPDGILALGDETFRHRHRHCHPLAIASGGDGSFGPGPKCVKTNGHRQQSKWSMAPGARTKPTGQAKEARTCESHRPYPCCRCSCSHFSIHLHLIPFLFESSLVLARRNRQNEKSIELNEWKSGKCINEWMTAGTVSSSSGSSIHLFTFHPDTPPPVAASRS